LTSRADLKGIYQGETKLVPFNFSSDLASGETISTKAVTATVYSGTDASPSAVISGSATSSGAIVTQKVIGQTLGVIYELLCEITTSLGQTLRQVGLLAVIPREP
jgi:hypothetical protein